MAFLVIKISQKQKSTTVFSRVDLFTFHLRGGETEAQGGNDSLTVTELSSGTEILWTRTLRMFLFILGDSDGGMVSSTC